MEVTNLEEKRLLVKLYNTLLYINVLNLETSYTGDIQRQGAIQRQGDAVQMTSGHMLLLDQKCDLTDIISLLVIVLDSISNLHEPRFLVAQIVDHKLIYGVA